MLPVLAAVAKASSPANRPPISPGHHLALPRPPGSADALLLTQLQALQGSLVVLTASAWDAQRLLEEIRWFNPQLSVHLFPDWETLPYDHFSPHPDLVSERLDTLWQLHRGEIHITLVPVTTALYRLPPVAWLAARSFALDAGQRLPLSQLRAQLVLAGYDLVTQVQKPGEYCVRGGLMDLFPMGSMLPYRIEWLDDEVETLRTFDVDSQRSLYPVRQIRLLPAREFPLDDAGRTTFRQRFRDRFEGDPSRCNLYRDITAGLAPGGIEYYLPLFFEETATLFDYVPEGATVCLHGDLNETVNAFWQSTQSRWNLLHGDRTRPVMDPAELFLSQEQLFLALGPRARLNLGQGEVANPPAFYPQALPLPALEVERHHEDPVHRLRQWCQDFNGQVIIAAESLGRRETLRQMLAQNGLPAEVLENLETAPERVGLWVAVSPLAQGFIWPSRDRAFVTEGELYRTQVRQSRRRDKARTTSEFMLRDLAEVQVGDPVVHQEHGIGRYRGLVTLDLGDGPTEFLHLEYASEDSLYVPVAQLSLIGRYTGGSPESAPLHRLGTEQWTRARKRAAEQAHDAAAELLDIHAQRAARTGLAFPFSEVEYQRFCQGFDFEETPDQAAAIAAVINDMRQGKPMDRLVCGDVGFGKTEVAMRAAFVAIHAGRQVALLVPTTLLAEQHYQNFTDRFSESPVKIAELSRFRSAREMKATLEGLQSGQVDMVIGTHKLLSGDVNFANLGLVIIDEEHRFGVRQKERLKALRAEVDVLTLTATPIPRTLAMSMEGLRDFSVIASPPQRRLAIKTFVYPWSDGMVREAALRELKRGGQLYFLHNDVDTMERMREHLAQLIPEARIAVAHGQLRERELEQVMREFYHQQHNLLLCSTIIETGIDVPTANTIVINRADRFGLAQLHQLRGRVGRSHHQAYAYLMTPPEEALTPQAARRLEAIAATEDLGAGFYLSMQDLEIRGAGEVLGESQSGDIQQVGFALYTELLEQAVAALKSGKPWNHEAPLKALLEINLHAPALLPEDYCQDVHERLVLYKRLSHATTEDQLQALQEELLDRFGLLPRAAQVLLACHRLRIEGKPLGLRKVDAHAEAITLQFGPDTPLEPHDLIMLLQSRRDFRLMGPDRLRVNLACADPLERADQVVNVFRVFWKG
jgi:transcription-repair coupling factor (superfamily II helicase)